MMMAFALWSVAHMLVGPNARTGVLAVAILVLALFGSHLQDRRKGEESPVEWRVWMARTRFWPNWRALPALGFWWPVSILLWLLVTWIHQPLSGIPAGLWLWLR